MAEHEFGAAICILVQELARRVRAIRERGTQPAGDKAEYDDWVSYRVNAFVRL